MQVQEWLTKAQADLLQHGITTARLDTLVLLEDVLDMDRARILAEPTIDISAEQTKKLKKLLSLRAMHTPLAYVRGHSEFYGRDFVITPDVLVPRPESETMIELLKELPIVQKRASKSGSGGNEASSSDYVVVGQPAAEFNGLGPSLRWDDGVGDAEPLVRIADVGCGSGALGITAALELQNVYIELLDIDAAALKVAAANVDKFTLNIQTIKSDLLAQSSQDYDILLCNLPYVPDNYPVNEAASHEPAIALFAGSDGLDLYKQLFNQLQIVEKKPLYILIEAFPDQHRELSVLAANEGYTLFQTEDFIQVFALS